MGDVNTFFCQPAYQVLLVLLRDVRFYRIEQPMPPDKLLVLRFNAWNMILKPAFVSTRDVDAIPLTPLAHLVCSSLQLLDLGCHGAAL
jgi:hypothetical protein